VPPRTLLIGVAGMVGAGKSTLTRALAARHGLELAPESVGDANPWLERYYERGVESMREYALRLQLHFPAARFESMRRVRATGGGWVLDRTWYEDAEVFARGLYEERLMTAPEWELYERLYAELLHSPAARPPALLVYLHGPLDVILARIARRGRPKERDAAVAYWAQLHRRYERWIADFRRCPVLAIDVREYDLVADPAAVDAVAARVRARLEPELPQTEFWPGELPTRRDLPGVTFTAGPR
jgi:deoxyadenosine/deoxycytidine kinase